MKFVIKKYRFSAFGFSNLEKTPTASETMRHRSSVCENPYPYILEVQNLVLIEIFRKKIRNSIHTTTVGAVARPPFP